VRGLKAVSEPLTAGRRARVETTFGAPISISYGLNEIGVVASCCPEAGRYHVHDEHCLIEIVDGDGQPSAPGEYGHMYVTSLTNYAMPLIRYDTGDIAQALDGPCPCGRTLPSFGQIQGRRSRIEPVPREVLALADTVLEAVARLPADLSRNLRMYQLHHSVNGNFELRTVVAGGLPPAFDAQIAEIWRTAAPSNPTDLRVVTVENIRPAPSDKFFHFDSDFFSQPIVS
jgi:phenylacetate-CoA ligase